jgi:hypothetical protein
MDKTPSRKLEHHNKDFNMSFLNRVPERTIPLALLLQILIMGTVLAASGAASSPSKNLTVEEAYPGLATGMLKLAKLSDLGKGEILKTQDVLIKESSLNEVLSKTEPAMQAQLAKYKFFLLERHAMNMILLQEAKKAGSKENEPEEEITGPHSFMPFFSSVAYFLKQFCRQQRTVPEPVEPLHSMSL